MADILSQAEIDALLASLASGEDSSGAPEPEAPDQGVKVYNFKTANKFTKEQIRTLSIVYKNFGQLMSNYLAGVLRTACDVETLSIEEMSFNEFNNSLPTPVLLAIVKMPPLSGSIILQLSEEVSYSVISRIFGGMASTTVTGKQFTEIELAIMERISLQFLRLLDQAWVKVISIHSSLERLETSVQFAQIVEVNEPVAVITNNVTIGSESGILSMCIPHEALEPVAKQLNARMWYSSSPTRQITSNPELISEKLKNANLNITAVFEDTTATVRDITRLRVGDVIQLNHKVGEPVVLKLQHIPKFHGNIGASGGKCAVKIVDIIEGEEE